MEIYSKFSNRPCFKRLQNNPPMLQRQQLPRAGILLQAINAKYGRRALPENTTLGRLDCIGQKALRSLCRSCYILRVRLFKVVK